jgi:hypothetical protein
MDRQVEPLVMASEIQGLEDLHSFLKLGNNVTRFSFPHMDRDLIAPPFVARDIPEGDMWLNPLAPAQPKPPASTSTVAAPAATTPTVALVTAAPFNAHVAVQALVKQEGSKAPSIPTAAPMPPQANVPIFGPAELLPAPEPIGDL